MHSHDDHLPRIAGIIFLMFSNILSMTSTLDFRKTAVISMEQKILQWRQISHWVLNMFWAHGRTSGNSIHAEWTAPSEIIQSLSLAFASYGSISFPIHLTWKPFNCTLATHELRSGSDVSGCSLDDLYHTKEVLKEYSVTCMAWAWAHKINVISQCTSTYMAMLARHHSFFMLILARKFHLASWSLH